MEEKIHKVLVSQDDDFDPTGRVFLFSLIHDLRGMGMPVVSNLAYDSCRGVVAASACRLSFKSKEEMIARITKLAGDMWDVVEKEHQ